MAGRSSYYTYLISSLPMLRFGIRPSFSFKKFLQLCQALISDSDINILKTASISGEYPQEMPQPALKRWRDFDTALRNELVKIRAARRGVEPLKYLRRTEHEDFSLFHLGVKAYRAPSVLEAEDMLDQQRWRFLDELAIGHYFDLDLLIVYALKLLILERWGRIRQADKSRLLQEALEKI